MIVALGAGLTACGGDEDPPAADSASPQRAAGGASGGPPAQDRASREREEEGTRPGGASEQPPSEPPQSARSAAERDSGGGADRFRVPEGDNSIQGFGEEASDSERESAAVVLHAFLQAQANERWTAACFYLAEDVLEQLRQLADQVEGADGKGCPETLEAISPPVSRAAAAELTDVDVGSLRVEDERAFILYEGAAGETYTVNMADEDGEWKVASLAPVPLS